MKIITRKLYCTAYPYKRGFPTELDAKISLIHIKDDAKREKIPVRVYKCEICGLFHTTSEGIKDETRIKNTKERNAARIQRVFEATKN